MPPEKDEILKFTSFKTARSGGSGGQNVNKVETKVLLTFDLNNASIFTEVEKARIKYRLANRLNNDGHIQVQSQEDRSQLLNKENAVKKLMLLLDFALKIAKPRKPSNLPKSVILKRLQNKAVRAERKKNRAKPGYD